MQISQRTKNILAVAALVVLVTGWWYVNQGDGGAVRQDSRAGATTSAATDSGSTETDPATGLQWIDESALPPEARETLALIDAGGPYPYDADDGTFGNFEGVLPDQNRGYYREYTVETPGSRDRGARRIVTGADGEFFYTSDHYSSFERIRR